MRIKTSRRSSASLLGELAGSERVRAALWYAVRAGVLLALLVVVARRVDPGFDPVPRVLESARSGANWVVAQLRAAPPRLQFDIRHENYMRLAFQRQQALERGVLLSSPGDLVPATLRVGDRSLRVKVRLKGDMSDHWADGHKWSLRVVVRGDEALFGMKQFSIQHPGTRAYLEEWLLHQALRREGLPALRYDFVEVVVNGRDLGIYALEEHFEKRLLENSGRREGPIVRFNEDLCWAEIAEGLSLDRRAACHGPGSGSYMAADVDAFGTAELLADPVGYPLYLKALHLLDAFRRGELPTSEVFDVELLARYFAVLELLDELHASYWRNARFYYNPITARLEPIAFDGGSAGQPPTRALAPALRAIYDTRDPNNYHYHLRYLDSLFEDAAFFARYVRELERVTAPGYLEDLLGGVDAELRRKLAVLHTEFPGLRFSTEPLFERRRFLRGWLSPAKAVHAHLAPDGGGGIALDVGNLIYLPVEVLGLASDTATWAPQGGPALLGARPAARSPRYERIAFAPRRGSSAPAPSAAEPLRVRHRILGASSVSETPVFAWPAAGGARLSDDVTRAAPNVEQFDFLVVDEAERLVRVRPGSWRVERDLVVPRDYRLRAGPGAELVLTGGAVILSRAPLELVGREDRPVVVRAGEGAGGSLVVIGARETSLLEHARFEGLDAPRRAGWQLTGGVTFYESPVSIASCRFVGSRGEDALNLVRSSFSLERSLFEDSASDALDLDWSDGSIADTTFVRSGNDAVDASGSTVRVEGLRITRAGDKGISAGEESRLGGRDVHIRDAPVAVASKDGSRVDLSELRVEDAGVAFAVYRKKPEYGPALLRVTGATLERVARPHLLEQGSRLFVEGEPVTETQADVASLLQPAP